MFSLPNAAVARAHAEPVRAPVTAAPLRVRLVQAHAALEGEVLLPAILARSAAPLAPMARTKMPW
jgi:hypothetical protein